jgi:hypothetical protein
LALGTAWFQGPKIPRLPCESMSLGNPEILMEKSPRHQA